MIIRKGISKSSALNRTRRRRTEMKKKLLTVLLAVAMVFSLTACGTLTNKHDDRADIFDNWSNTGAPAEKASTTTNITIPAEILTLAGYTHGDDLAGFKSERGYSSANWNDDGSITASMKTADFENMQKTMFDETKASLAALVGAEGTAFITAIEPSDTLDTVTVTVINADYVAARDAGLGLNLSVGLLANMARYFTGETAAIITVIDSETGEEIESF